MSDGHRSRTLLKSITVASAIIATVIGVLSAAKLIERAGMVSWVEPLDTIFLEYERITHGLFSYLTPLVEALLDFIGLEISLQDHWSDPIILLALYFGVRAQTYVQYGFTRRGPFRMILGGLLALAVGVLSGTSSESNTYFAIYTVSAVVAGIVLFDLVDSAVSATWARKSGLTWRADFKRYQDFIAPHTIYSLTVLVVGVTVTLLLPTLPQKYLANGLLLVLALGLTIIWYWSSWRFSGSEGSGDPQLSRYARFRRSSATNIGDRMLVCLGAGVLFLVSNAGLAYL